MVNLVQLNHLQMKCADTVMLVTFPYVEMVDFLLALQSPLSYENQVIWFGKLMLVKEKSKPNIGVDDLLVIVNVKTETKKNSAFTVDFDAPLSDVDFSVIKGPACVVRKLMDKETFSVFHQTASVAGGDPINAKVEVVKGEDETESSVSLSGSGRNNTKFESTPVHPNNDPFKSNEDSLSSEDPARKGFSRDACSSDRSPTNSAADAVSREPSNTQSMMGLDTPTRYVYQSIDLVISREEKNLVSSTPPLKCRDNVVSSDF